MSDHAPRPPTPPPPPREQQPDHPHPAGPGRVCWVDLDEPAEARRVLHELRAWMGIALTHEPQVIELLRPCWYRHPAVVQTLLDVQAAWVLAHRSDLAEAAAADRALEFTARHLPHLEHRLSRLLAQCTSVRHDPPETRLPRPGKDEAAAYLRWWAGERTPHTEPEGAT